MATFTRTQKITLVYIVWSLLFSLVLGTFIGGVAAFWSLLIGYGMLRIGMAIGNGTDRATPTWSHANSLAGTMGVWTEDDAPEETEGGWRKFVSKLTGGRWLRGADHPIEDSGFDVERGDESH
jgi:hypothetical protein